MAKSAVNISEAWRKKWRPAGVPVLLYHGITGIGTPPIPVGENKFWITNLQFVDQMERIRAGGYEVGPSLSELCRLPEIAVQAPQLALTFDDGHATDYTDVFPLLCEYGFRADFFINTATVGSTGYLTWNQIGEMHGAGMSFQSHSHHHVNLSLMPPARLHGQLGYSKLLIEDRLGAPVEFLSVPYGLVNKRVFAAARKEGYRAVCTSRNWPAQPCDTQIARVCIHSHTDSQEFEGLLARDFSPYAVRSVREALLYLPKQILLRLKPNRLAAQAAGGVR
jgi:peptidoglycan/xylan/chitin deacetylase (PgdA/CDA1 family)